MGGAGPFFRRLLKRCFLYVHNDQVSEEPLLFLPIPLLGLGGDNYTELSGGNPPLVKATESQRRANKKGTISFASSNSNKAFAEKKCSLEMFLYGSPDRTDFLSSPFHPSF